MIVAFSRSSRPIRPISCESEIAASGSSCVDHGRSLLLGLGVDGREDRRDRDRADPLRGEVGGGSLQLVRLDRGDPAPVELVAAVADAHVAAERVAQRSRPPDHRRQRLRRRQPEPDHPGRSQPPRLDDRVREVRRPDHHRLHARHGDTRGLDERADRRRDPAGHVRRRRRLRLGEHVAAVDEDGVGVRAADVDADSHA